MTDLEFIENKVQQLPPADLAKFSEWFREYEWRIWDLEIEQHSKSGKLKALAEKVLAGHTAGRTHTF